MHCALDIVTSRPVSNETTHAISMPPIGFQCLKSQFHRQGLSVFDQLHPFGTLRAFSQSPGATFSSLISWLFALSVARPPPPPIPPPKINKIKIIYIYKSPDHGEVSNLCRVLLDCVAVLCPSLIFQVHGAASQTKGYGKDVYTEKRRDLHDTLALFTPTTNRNSPFCSPGHVTGVRYVVIQKTAVGH